MSLRTVLWINQLHTVLTLSPSTWVTLTATTIPLFISSFSQFSSKMSPHIPTCSFFQDAASLRIVWPFSLCLYVLSQWINVSSHTSLGGCSPILSPGWLRANTHTCEHYCCPDALLVINWWWLMCSDPDEKNKVIPELGVVEKRPRHCQKVILALN